MQNSKLIQILKTLTSDEIKEFQKLIDSQFFGCKKFVVKFFLELKRYYPEFRKSDIEKKKIYSRLYPGREYNDGLIRRMTSDLINLAEEYFMYKSFKATQMFRDTCLLDELRVRKLNNIFEIKSINMLREIDSENINSNSLLRKFFVENEVISFILKGDQKQLLDTSYSAANSLIASFLSSLNNKTQLIQNRKIPAANNNSNLYDLFLKHFSYDKFINSLDDTGDKYTYFIKTNYFATRLMTLRNDKDSYLKLTELLNSSKNYFEGIFKYNYYIILSTFCTDQIMNNNFEYINQYFNNIEVVLKEKLFLANSSILTSSIIRRIVMFSILQKNIAYTEMFVKSYSKYFNPADKKSLINYCNAMIAFAKGQFGKALEYSSAIDLQQLEFKFEVKVLKTKSFFELDYEESFLSEIDTFKHFLSYENSLNVHSKVRGNHFIKFIYKIFKLRDIPGIDNRILLENEIKKENLLNEKNWLLEKVSLITGRNK